MAQRSNVYTKDSTEHIQDTNKKLHKKRLEDKARNAKNPKGIGKIFAFARPRGKF